MFLRVVRRREDGYHDLASLFHVIDLGDDMTFEALGGGAGGAPADALTCDMEGVPTDSSNLVIKVWVLVVSGGLWGAGDAAGVWRDGVRWEMDR